MPGKCPHCHASLPAALSRVAGKSSCPECGEALSGVETAAASEGVSASGSQAWDPDADDPLLQKILGGCRLERLLGRGSMASVYKATKLNLDMTVAVKVIRRDVCHDEQVLQRFQQEARTVAKFQTPNVVRVLDVGYDTAQRVHFLVMEYVDDGTLRDFALSQNRKGLEPRDAVGFLQQACRALLEAKNLSVVHRDIKPENLLLNSTGTVKVADFGLSKIHGATLNMTDPGQLMGTPLYASPEQCRAQELDFRSDIYSLGASFYYLLTGLPPAEGSSFYKILDTKTKTSFLSPEKAPLDKKIPGPISRIIEKMTALDKEDRYGSIEALIEDCRRVSRGEEPLATPPPHRPTTGMLKRPRKAKAAKKEVSGPEERHPLDRRPRISDGRPGTVPVLKYAILAVVVVGLAWGGYSVLAKGNEAASAEIRTAKATAAEARSLLDTSVSDENAVRAQLTRVERAIRRVGRYKNAENAMGLLQQLRELRAELESALAARRESDERARGYEESLTDLEHLLKDEAELVGNFEQLLALGKRLAEETQIHSAARKRKLVDRVGLLEAKYRKRFRAVRIRPLEARLRDLETKVDDWGGDEAELDSIGEELARFRKGIDGIPAPFRDQLGELPEDLKRFLAKIESRRATKARIAALAKELAELAKIEERTLESTEHRDLEQLLAKAKLLSKERDAVSGSLPADRLAKLDKRLASIHGLEEAWKLAAQGFERRLDALRPRLASEGPALLEAARKLGQEVDQHRPGMPDELKSDVAAFLEKVRAARPAKVDPGPVPPKKPGSVTVFGGKPWRLPTELRAVLKEQPKDGDRRSFVFSEDSWEAGTVMVLVEGGKLADGTTVAPFLMDRFVVTHGRYQRFLKELEKLGMRDASRRTARDRAPFYKQFEEAKRILHEAKDPKLPAVGYTLIAARDFAGVAMPGRSLPTTLEWEYAAIGESTDRFPWGDEPRSDAGWKRTFDRTLPRVDAYAGQDASRWGVVGLASGVMEWCEKPVPDEKNGWIRGLSHVKESRLAKEPVLDRAVQESKLELPARRRRINVGFRCIIRLEEQD